jgi:RNA polymerase sigma factor (sigma-70 family)
MKTEIKKDSEQAVKDKISVAVLQDANATARTKDNAFGVLYKTHNQQVRIHFLKRLRDADVADDLLMVTFCKVHENINSYNANAGAFSTWLYKIANNTLIDHSRKDKFEVLSLDSLIGKTSEYNDGMEFQIDSGIQNPQELIVHKEVKDQIKEAVYSIKSKSVRDLMICRYIDELSYKDAANKLGLEMSSTLRTSVRKGKKILKNKLENLKTYAS